MLHEIVIWLNPLVTKVPSDLPEIGYANMHENLLFKAGEALSKTIQEFVENEIP